MNRLQNDRGASSNERRHPPKVGHFRPCLSRIFLTRRFRHVVVRRLRAHPPQRAPVNSFCLTHRFLLALSAALAACCAPRTTPQNVAGRYELRGKGWLAGQSVILRSDHTFENTSFTDALSKDQPNAITKTSGRYRLEGCLLTFQHPRGPRHRCTADPDACG